MQEANPKNVALREQVLRASGVNPLKCMRCGKCSGTCPAYGEMEYHPHEFVYMVEKGELEKLMRSPSVYACLSCFACVDRCPRGVEPRSWWKRCGWQWSDSRGEIISLRTICRRFSTRICPSRQS